MTIKKRRRRQTKRRPRRPGNPARRNCSPSRPRGRPTGPVRSTARLQGVDVDPPADEQSLLDELNALDRSLVATLTHDNPLIFLLEASQTYASYDERTVDNHERIDLADRLELLARWELASFRAIGYAMSRMAGRDHEREAFDRAHSQGSAEFPVWLREIDATEITGCWRGCRDDEPDDVIGVGIRFADGQEGTVVIITCSDTGEIGDAYLSLCPYAETALNWATRDSMASSLTRITYHSAKIALAQAIRHSDPRDPAEPGSRAAWVTGRAILEWLITKLAAAVNAPDAG